MHSAWLRIRKKTQFSSYAFDKKKMKKKETTSIFFNMRTVQGHDENNFSSYFICELYRSTLKKKKLFHIRSK